MINNICRKYLIFSMYFLFSAFLSVVHNTLYYRTQYSVPSFKVLRTEIMNRIEVLYAALTH